MDAALFELLEGAPDEEVAAILRLRPGEPPPRGVRLHARFGEIATCRLRRGDIVAVRADPTVLSMKASRPLQHEADDLLVETPAPPLETIAEIDERRPPGLAATGSGVVIGVVDWGADIAHPDFRSPDGRTRFSAIWDQAAPYDSSRPNPYGFGTIHLRPAIDDALRAADPYSALRYRPGDADPEGTGTHGTHVLSIAAGNGRGGGPLGLAPEAELAFVHLSTLTDEGFAGLGDSVALLEAVDFLFRLAEDRPCVLNLSMGRHCGPHDGTTLVEQGLDAAVLGAPGRAICQSAGNYFGRRIHTQGLIRPGDLHPLTVVLPTGGVLTNEIEIWYSGRDRLVVTVRGPEGALSTPVRLGDQTTIAAGDHPIARVYHRAHDPNNHDHHIEVFIYPGAPGGTWTVELYAEDVVDGRFHAWVERQASRKQQGRFDDRDAVDRATTGTICNGYRTIAVGAYDGHSPAWSVASFSSLGPTRDGRQKPDLVAPGVHVLAARSAPRDPTGPYPLLARMSGTSMAAPHATGTVALMFEAAGRPLMIEETRRLLLTAADPGRTGTDAAAVGSGYLDVTEAVAAATQPRPSFRAAPAHALGATPEEESMIAKETAEASTGVEPLEAPLETPACSEGAGEWAAHADQLVDLIQPPVRTRSHSVGARENESEGGVAVAAVIEPGEEVIERVPLLASHRGMPPDLVLRWNHVPADAATVDVAVHFHGYSDRGERMNLVSDTLPRSGLDFGDPDAAAGAAPGRDRPTLCILPRGNFFGGSTERGYNFPSLIAPEAFEAFLTYALQRFAAATGRATPAVARLLLTAHSGGGAALLRVVRSARADEVHLFDALYQQPTSLITWAKRRIAEDRTEAEHRSPEAAEAYLREHGGVLRATYIPTEGTTPYNVALHNALCASIPPSPVQLHRRFRVQRTSRGHANLPRGYGWRLLADPAVDLPDTTSLRCPGRQPAEVVSERSGLATPLIGFTSTEVKALRITNAFENTTQYDRTHDLVYGSVAGDFDDQGLSLGMFQWNIGRGSLQPLLRRFAAEQPDRFAAVFGDQATEVGRVLQLSDREQLTWARSINTNDRRTLVPEWGARFERLLQEPGFQKIMLDAACPLLASARCHMRELEVASERAFAFLFDTVVQNGAHWPDVKGRRQQVRTRLSERRQSGSPLAERDILRVVAEVLGDTVRPQFRAGVVARRLAIVDGRGRVHGHDFDLAREFDLSDAPLPGMITATNDVMARSSTSVIPTASPPAVSPPGPPAAPPRTAPSDRVEYAPGTRYTPMAGRFQCSPTPVTVTPASLLPAPTNDPDAAARGALSDAGVGQTELDAFERGGGLAALRLVAAAFGRAALFELLGRLRYTVRQLIEPPATVRPRAVGAPSVAALLTPRVLLAIPGHFRELARRAPSAEEAYIVECAGWLAADALRNATAQGDGINWWLPAAPRFVAPLPAAAPSPSATLARFVADSGLFQSGDAARFAAGYQEWSAGIAGRTWRLERGAESSSRGTGRPFYSETVTIPDAIDVANDRTRIDGLWQRRVADVSAHHTPHTPEWARALHDCDNEPLQRSGLLSSASFGGLEMVYDFPVRVSGGAHPRVLHAVSILAGAQGVFESVFRTIALLGWNDLLFQTAGAGCLRGTNLGEETLRRDPERYYSAAERISNHGYGLAIDCNVPENGQRTTGSMDPRIVAVFEAFHFRWGKCFPVSDPMHFEYRGAP